MVNEAEVVTLIKPCQGNTRPQRMVTVVENPSQEVVEETPATHTAEGVRSVMDMFSGAGEVALDGNMAELIAKVSVKCQIALNGRKCFNC